MTAQTAHPTDPLQTDCLLPIVVGAHLRAEIEDRPIAYGLLELITARQAARGGDEESLRALVCTDVWYLNAPDLRLQPTIAIGNPAWNAATAFCAARLPTALVVDDVYRVHLDPEFVSRQACLWGADPARTSAAVDAFVERYLDEFLATR